MKILDRIFLNRLIAIIGSIVIAIAKIFAANSTIDDDIVPTPPKEKKPLFPKLRKKKQ